MKLESTISFLYKIPVIKYLFHFILKLYGVHISPKAKTAKGLTFPHLGQGVVIHPSAKISSNAIIYHQVTIGRSDVWIDRNIKEMGKSKIEKKVIIGSEAKILIDNNGLKIGNSTIIGANGIFSKSTGEHNVWVENMQ